MVISGKVFWMQRTTRRKIKCRLIPCWISYFRDACNRRHSRCKKTKSECRAITTTSFLSRFNGNISSSRATLCQAKAGAGLILEMHVTDVTLGVYKQNLNAGLLQQHHFWAGLLAIFRVAVLLFVKPKLELNSSFGLTKSSTATRNIAIKPAQKWRCCNSPAFRFCIFQIVSTHYSIIVFLVNYFTFNGE